jgi:hypothetical protein
MVCLYIFYHEVVSLPQHWGFGFFSFSTSGVRPSSSKHGHELHLMLNYLYVFLGFRIFYHVVYWHALVIFTGVCSLPQHGTRIELRT